MLRCLGCDVEFLFCGIAWCGIAWLWCGISLFLRLVVTPRIRLVLPELLAWRILLLQAILVAILLG